MHRLVGLVSGDSHWSPTIGSLAGRVPPLDCCALVEAIPIVITYTWVTPHNFPACVHTRSCMRWCVIRRPGRVRRRAHLGHPPKP